MADSDENLDIDSYILSSKYRICVLEQLSKEGEATPTGIAESVGLQQPHISRALSELEEQGVVELRVSESRKVRRYYGLTERGTEVWSTVKARLNTIEWSDEPPTEPALKSVVERARTEFGSGLRVVVEYDGEDASILHADSAVLSKYSDKEFERGLHNLILEHSIDEVALPNQDCWSEILHFDDFSILKVLIHDGRRILISFGNDHNVSVPEFSEDIASIFS
ncbi:winged helix-turn-helix domain-containing protein [Halorubrum trueperi]|uniref:Winged helix-turn-helix domain-containing protein n=1 Tax=Halorubrum trueperi TaxID=2004704 RepID=A0ABD5UHJ2_9EURY